MKYQYTIQCSVRGCRTRIYKKTKRPHKDVCVEHFRKLFPDEFDRYVGNITVRESEKQEKRRLRRR